MPDMVAPRDQKPDSYDGELLSLFDSIAESLAALSEFEEGPTGYDLHVDPFDAHEVDFKNNSWLLRLAQVQPWLHLDASIARPDIEDDALSAAAAMLRSMGRDDVGKCLVVDGGVVTLTVVGADLLSVRLEVALKLATKFTEAREDLSRKAATAEWEESWEEEEEFGEPDPEPIKAKTDNWRISDFAGKATENHLNLNPTYQRGDVWPVRDAQKLIESILRGIPLPSIIILRPPSSGTNVVYEVVDGKQRLTSILRFIGKHPKAIARVAEEDRKHPEIGLAKWFQDDYRKFKRLWRTHVGESLTAKTEAQYYFPFALAQSSPAFRGDLAPLAGRYFHDIRDEMIQVGDYKQSVKVVFEGPGEYKIPLIEYIDAKPRQIHDVFHLYNRQGKHLNAEEIRNAVFHDLDLVKLLLVAAGDNPDIEKLAGFLAEEKHEKIKAIASMLDDYRFGTARYKRTKMLSWLTALLMCSAVDGDKLVIRSTAKQINTLLEEMKNSKPETPHPLQDRARLRKYIDDLHVCLGAHSGCDGWAEKFRDDASGVKWQELQLVASLVGIFLASLVVADMSAVLDLRREALLDLTRSMPRPKKTQNKTQWAYIGAVALGVLDVLQVTQDAASNSMRDRYGADCIPTLRAARELYEPAM